MSKGNQFETDILALIFNATAIADIAQNDGSGPLTQLWVSLHTANPNEGGAQNTSEATYGSYARVAVDRDSSGWTVASGEATNAENVVFPECSSGSNTITHIGIGTASSSTGKLLFYGELTAPLNVTTGIEPRFPAGDIVITED